jgi:hypothetical protein
MCSMHLTTRVTVERQLIIKLNFNHSGFDS